MFKRYRTPFFIFFLFLPSASFSGETAPSGVIPADSQSSNAIEGRLSALSCPDGSILIATLKLPEEVNPELLTASLGDTTDIPFFREPKLGKSFYQAVIGVPFNHAPGKLEVLVSIGPKERAKVLALPFEVVDGHYRSETLKVDEKKVSPPKKELKRILSEQAEIDSIYHRMTRQKLWEGPFGMPVASAITSPFGSKRVYNGEMRSFHQGIDLRAKIGTRILAPARGIVVLAKDLYYTGNTVLIDHGYGVFTVYGHMSALKVKAGDLIEKNTVLGLSGMTGRANGPHLHWGAVVNRLKVNPLDLTRVMP